MKSEQEKYIEAMQKAVDFKKAFDELKPESRQRLFKELLEVASLQEAMSRLQYMMYNMGIR